MSIFVILLAYFIGALPVGYFLLKLIKKTDITEIGSGRTGGTNAMRAGGLWLGILTAVGDGAKGFVSVLLARWLVPGSIWVEAFAGAAAVLGHNWSIWLYFLKRRFSAGAGAAPNIGAAIAFWAPSVWISIPVMLFFIFVVGYASLATFSSAVVLLIIFFLRSALSQSPWAYVVYAGLTTLMVVAALLPNFKRLLKGTERRVGIFAKKVR